METARTDEFVVTTVGVDLSRAMYRRCVPAAPRRQLGQRLGRGAMAAAGGACLLRPALWLWGAAP
eukprot:COSAG01_NODE_7960_length_2970_cov_1.416203_3_plen_65_part_00